MRSVASCRGRSAAPGPDPLSDDANRGAAPPGQSAARGVRGRGHQACPGSPCHPWRVGPAGRRKYGRIRRTNRWLRVASCKRPSGRSAPRTRPGRPSPPSGPPYRPQQGGVALAHPPPATIYMSSPDARDCLRRARCQRLRCPPRRARQPARAAQPETSRLRRRPRAGGLIPQQVMPLPRSNASSSRSRVHASRDTAAAVCAPSRLVRDHQATARTPAT